MFARMERKHHMADNPLPDGGSPSWADVMSDEGKTAEVDDGNQEDMCDQLLRHFPVPGEIWVHLRTHCNYLSSLLAMYACPHVGDLPLIINGWRSMQKLSPYRVAYGTHNPAMHGLILTHDTVVPNFSWTPRLALEVEAMETVLQYPLPLDVLVLPAVTCDVVRVFFYDCQWYIASNSVVEVVPKNRGLGGPLSMRFQLCLGKHCKRGLWKYLSDLRHDRVWFFGLYEQPSSLLHLGTCATIPHHLLVSAQYDQLPHLDFSVHRFLAPCIPILPDLITDLHQCGITEGAYDGELLAYAAQYDGIFLVNPVTMFAVRLCTPDVVFLSPLLQGKQDISDFLIGRVIESRMMDISRLHMDRMSRRWWGTQVSAYVDAFFSESQADLIAIICWQVETMPQWISVWMSYMGSLCWQEWNQLDVDLQRLYVLLDYAWEEPHADTWSRILKHSKYSEWVAKVVAFTLAQNQSVQQFSVDMYAQPN